MPIVARACFLDFDHTLFHTDEFFHVDVRNAFLHLGIGDDVWRRAYDAVWHNGYTLEKHAAEISRRTGGRIPLEEMNVVLKDAFSDLRKYVFPDVVPFLEMAKERGFSTHLLSFGDEAWQKYKVKSSGLWPYFNEVFFTGREGMKAGVVFERSPDGAEIHIIDNNPDELDVIKDRVPQCRTWRINRVPDEHKHPSDESSRLLFLEARRYTGKTGRYPHSPCTSLIGIL